MKKIILILFTAHMFGSVRAQIPTDPETHKFVYEGVVKTDSLSPETLFKNGKEWIVRNLKSSDSNVNLDDREHRTLTSTGNISLEDRRTFSSNVRNFTLNFKFSIFIKEGRYKYIVENFYYSCQAFSAYSSSAKSGPFEELNFSEKKVYTEANAKIMSLIKSLTDNMSSSTKKNDW